MGPQRHVGNIYEFNIFSVLISLVTFDGGLQVVLWRMLTMCVKVECHFLIACCSMESPRMGGNYGSRYQQQQEYYRDNPPGGTPPAYYGNMQQPQHRPPLQQQYYAPQPRQQPPPPGMSNGVPHTRGPVPQGTRLPQPAQSTTPRQGYPQRPIPKQQPPPPAPVPQPRKGQLLYIVSIQTLADD